ncbi:MAG: hypothetical protein RI900_2699, partial [Actinomycetota bacterium]
MSDTADAPRPRAGYSGDVIVAVDIGGTKMAAGLVTMQGELIDRDQIAVDHDLQAEALFAGLRELIEQQMERAREHHRLRPAAVGVGSAGPIARDVETVSPINIPVWRNFPLRERLAHATTLPV